MEENDCARTYARLFQKQGSPVIFKWLIWSILFIIGGFFINVIEFILLKSFQCY
jgi:hypothetical protein